MSFSHGYKKIGRGGKKYKEKEEGEKKKENTCLACVRTRAGHGPFSGSHRTPLTIF